MKGLDILYIGGSVVTIPSALQMEECAKEQSLSAGNTTDEEPTISIGYSLPQMSPNHLQEDREDMEKLFYRRYSSISSIVPTSDLISAQSKAIMSTTKTEERVAQQSGQPVTLSLMKDSGYHSVQYTTGMSHPSACSSDVGASPCPSKSVENHSASWNSEAGISLADGCDDFSLCTDEQFDMESL